MHGQGHYEKARPPAQPHVKKEKPAKSQRRSSTTNYSVTNRKPAEKIQRHVTTSHHFTKATDRPWSAPEHNTKRKKHESGFRISVRQPDHKSNERAAKSKTTDHRDEMEWKAENKPNPPPTKTTPGTNEWRHRALKYSSLIKLEENNCRVSFCIVNSIKNEMGMQVLSERTWLNQNHSPTTAFPPFTLSLCLPSSISYQISLLISPCCREKGREELDYACKGIAMKTNEQVSIYTSISNLFHSPHPQAQF